MNRDDIIKIIQNTLNSNTWDYSDKYTAVYEKILEAGYTIKKECTHKNKTIINPELFTKDKCLDCGKVREHANVSDVWYESQESTVLDELEAWIQFEIEQNLKCNKQMSEAKTSNETRLQWNIAFKDVLSKLQELKGKK